MQPTSTSTTRSKAFSEVPVNLIDYGRMPAAIYSNSEVALVRAAKSELQSIGIQYVSVFKDWGSSMETIAYRFNYSRAKMLES